jgi:hypothetical protein
MRRILADYDKRLQAAGTDSAKLGKLLIRRERRVKRKQLALDKGNAIMRLGEPPVVYDTVLTNRTVEQMTTYLHSEGFFRARVYATDTARTKRGPWRGFLYLTGLRKERPRRDSTGAIRPHRRVTVTYHITENQPFLVSQLTTSIPDSGVAQVVRQGQGASLLKVGTRYQEELIGQERTRLEACSKTRATTTSASSTSPWRPTPASRPSRCGCAPSLPTPRRARATAATPCAGCAW